MDFRGPFPRQNIPYKSKGKKWREECVEWCANKTYFNYPGIRQDVVHMKVNYDLLNGDIHMEDIARVLNPDNLSTAFLPDKIQHYPIINSKVNTLRGEEAARKFDYRAIVTNPYSISQMEEDKKAQMFNSTRELVENTELTQEQADQQLKDQQEYYDYSWQDSRELAANELLRHYSKEQNFQQTFNNGFGDVCAVSREFYQVGILGGEPFLRKLNPIKLRSYRNGYSDRIEDADIIVYEDYWAPGRVFETYYDDLSPADVKKLIEESPELGGVEHTGAAGNVDESYGYVGGFRGEDGIDLTFDELAEFDGGIGTSLLPYDVVGNIRVINVWWRSLRKVLSVKSFDPETGNEVFDFYPETYVADEEAGEVATPVWISEMWEGTKIGRDIYVRIRPCLVQHNSLSNPCRCHAGIIGTIYNLNESKPYSLVDMMKPYSYLYDAIHAKLVDLIATNWGKLVIFDLAFKPKNWEVDKWMYFARKNKVLIQDSFNEGNKGAAMGKLAAGLNNASKGYVDADWGQSIQNYIELLQWTKDSMSELVGINRQREGNTYNRETVGGIERAVLQSSYITDWLFQKHEDTKKRVLEAFLEEAKGAFRGRSKKFQYILSDNSIKTLEVDGDIFAESDYGIVVDNSSDTQKLEGRIDAIAQAAMQNDYKASTLLRLFSSASLQDKIRLVEKSEKEAAQQQQQQNEAMQQLEQQKIQAEMEQRQIEMRQKEELAKLDSDTRIKVAEINSKAEELRLGIYEAQNNIDLRNRELDIEDEKLKQEILQFDKELNLKRDELNQKKEIEEKKIDAQKQIAKNKTTSSTTKK